MKILVITPRFPPMVGGQERQSELLADQLVSIGVDVTVLTEKHYEISKTSQTGYTINYLETRKSYSLPRFTMFIQTMLYQFKNGNEFDLILVRTFCLHSLALGLLRRLHIVSTKSLVMTDSTTEIPALLNSKFHKLLRWIFEGNEFVNAISPEVRAQIVSADLFPNRVHEIPNMVEVSNLSVSGKLPITVTRFLFLGNLVRDKGVFDLVSAFFELQKKFPGVELHIAGDGSQRRALEEYVCHLLLSDSVTFVGELSKDETYDFLQSGECLVYPSYFEGFGLVPFEAALMHLHVISTDVGVVGKYLSGRCRIIKPRDSESLLQNMADLARSRDERTFDNDEWIKELSPQVVIPKILKLA